MTELRHRATRLSAALAAIAVLFGALALLFVPGIVSAPTQAVAAVKKPLLVPGAFRLEGSNGYTVYVVGMPGYGKRSGGLLVYAHVKGRTVRYQAPAVVSEESIEADLGELGRVSVTFHRSGRPISAVCGDREIRFDSGSYEGMISFHGEEGYTSVEATTVPGDINFLLSLCDEGVWFSEGGAGRPRGAELYVRNPGLGQGLSLTKRRPGAAASIVAWMREYTPGGISIERYAEARIPGDDFTYDRRLRTATISPPAPFAGSARFDRGKKAGQRWRGDLIVDLPGRSDVPLTGASLRAYLTPAF